MIWNPVYTRSGKINCEIDHPGRGRVTITISEAGYPELWAEALARGVAPFVEQPGESEADIQRRFATLQRGAFCIALKRAGVLTPAQAVAAAQGAWPEPFEAALSGMGPDRADNAQIEWAALADVPRLHPIVDLIRESLGWTPERADALYT